MKFQVYEVTYTWSERALESQAVRSFIELDGLRLIRLEVYARDGRHAINCAMDALHHLAPHLEFLQLDELRSTRGEREREEAGKSSDV